MQCNRLGSSSSEDAQNKDSGIKKIRIPNIKTWGPIRCCYAIYASRGAIVKRWEG